MVEPVNVAVREVRPEECDALGALTVAAYRALGVELVGGYDEVLRDVATRAAAATVLVAVDGHGSVLGGVTFVDDPANPYAEFDDPAAAGFRMLAVAPAAQGRGVGELLVRACIQRAGRAGKTRLVIHSTPWMTAAHRLYERCGFRRAPALDWQPLPEVPLLAFVRALDAAAPAAS